MLVASIIALVLISGQEYVHASDGNCTMDAANLTNTVHNGPLVDDVILTCPQIKLQQQKKAVVNARYYWPNGADGCPYVPYVYNDYAKGCIFPFKYGGKNYTSCTYDVINRPWCAFQVDGNNNMVNYKFCEALDHNDIQEGLDHWMKHTCITFEETNNTDQPHVQFIVGSGCYSNLGRIAEWNGQPVSIGSGCSYLQIIVHEIGHAIGLLHEQSRMDRDDYIEVLWDNIDPGAYFNFRKELDNNFGVTYDYSSVMHYTDYGFSINDAPTLIAKDPLLQEIIGVRYLLTGFSHRDKLLVNRMNKCTEKWLAACNMSSDRCLNEGYIGKDCKCVCRKGTTGSNCENNEASYYAHLQSDLNENITTEKTIVVKMPTNTNVFTKVITPPACHKAILTFKYANMPFACFNQMVMVRVSPSDYYGVQLCKDDIYRGLTFESETKIIVVTYNFYNREKLTLWRADVKFKKIPGCTTTLTTEGPTCPPPVTCPMCPTTPTPAPIRHCVTGGNNHLSILPRGKSITITSPLYPKPYPRNKIECGWKLQAANKGALTIKCDEFQLHKEDKMKFHVPKVRYFSGQNALTSKPNIMIIKLSSARGNRGPGFQCTVSAK